MNITDRINYLLQKYGTAGAGNTRETRQTFIDEYDYYVYA